jgi:hypothetical protein
VLRPAGLAASRWQVAEIARLDGHAWFDARWRPVVSEAQLTSTGVAIVVLSADGGAPEAIVKLALTGAASGRLELETATLDTLHADHRLGRWRELIPRPISTGTLRGRRYRVDLPLAGEVVTGSLHERRLRSAVLREAAESIQVLHGVTAQTLPGGPALGREWVDTHVHELLRIVGGDSRLGLAVAQLREELYGALRGGTFAACRIHGDYWPGNLLFSPRGAKLPALAGIVDWDASGPVEPALHDILHLLLYTRRLVTGRELGEIVSEQLRATHWSGDERALLDGSWAWQGISDRHALLLYWLRQMAMHIRQQTSLGGWRVRIWQRRNVGPVLELL